MVVQHILTAGTVDERIMKALSAKDAAQSKLIDAVKAEVTAMAGNKNLAEDSYERLANAIILQAVTEYRTALKKIRKIQGTEMLLMRPYGLSGFSVPAGTAS